MDELNDMSPIEAVVFDCLETLPSQTGEHLAALRALVAAGADTKPAIIFARKNIRQVPEYITDAFVRRDDEGDPNPDWNDWTKMIIEMLEILCETPEQALDVLGSRPPKENRAIVNYFRARAEANALADAATSIKIAAPSSQTPNI